MTQLVETRGCRGDKDYSPKRESRISEMSPVYQQKAWHDTYERIRTDSICRLAEPESSGDRGCGQLAERLSDRKRQRQSVRSQLIGPLLSMPLLAEDWFRFVPLRLSF